MDSEKEFYERLHNKGVSRRDFMKYCTVLTATTGLSFSFVPKVAEVFAAPKERPPVIWLHFSECTGCSEGMLRSTYPYADELVLEILSVEYHETIMAAAGEQAEDQLHAALKKYFGKFICVVEGSVATKYNGGYGKIAGRSFLEIAKEVVPQAAATIAYGSCACWGGGKEPESLYMPRGVIMKRDLANVQMADQTKVTEDVTRAWYTEGAAKHPYEGETKPLPEDPQYRPGNGKYSWFKAPRYDGAACEVGPLARVLVAYGKGHTDIKPLVDNVLNTLGVPAAALFSTAARAIETVAVGDAMGAWIGELVENIKSGDTKTFQPYEIADNGMGVGLNDVPRGALGHWVKVEGKKIANYQYVVPSTWNLCPRDAKEQLGPVEEALIGTPVADPKQPLEVLRTVHSFDPCIACGVHVIDPSSNHIYKVKAL